MSVFPTYGPTITTDAFLLCDHASVENGRVYINGGFYDHVFVNGDDPAPRVNTTIVAVLRVPRSKWGQQVMFKISIVDRDSRDADMVHVEGNIVPDNGGADHDELVVPLVMPVSFNARLGYYDMVLEIDGERIKRIPLHFVFPQRQG